MVGWQEEFRLHSPITPAIVPSGHLVKRGRLGSLLEPRGCPASSNYTTGSMDVSVLSALVLLGTIVLLLGVFFVGVVVLTRSYRRRQRRRDDRASPTLPDPWREAGRRMEPPAAASPDPPEDGPA